VWVVAAVACAAAVVVPAVGPGAASGAATDCSSTVHAPAFAPTREFRALTAKLARFGLRSPGSTQHQKELAWLERELRAIPGMKVHSDPYEIARWQPLPDAPGKQPGRDLARAGALRIDLATGTRPVPVSGAVPFTLPTPPEGASGPLVYLPADEPITAANAQGRVIVREVPPVATPYAVFPAIAHSLTPDWPATGNYDRPYARPLDPTLIDAGKAGAAGVVFLWDAPTAQMRGYWDPHTGTRFQVPAVYAGSDRAPLIKRAAAQHRTGTSWSGRSGTRPRHATSSGRCAGRVASASW